MTIPLGELISIVYEKYLLLYGDEELASVAASVVVSEMLAAAGENQLGQAA